MVKGAKATAIRRATSTRPSKLLDAGSTSTCKPRPKIACLWTACLVRLRLLILSVSQGRKTVEDHPLRTGQYQEFTDFHIKPGIEYQHQSTRHASPHQPATSQAGPLSSSQRCSDGYCRVHWPLAFSLAD